MCVYCRPSEKAWDSLVEIGPLYGDVFDGVALFAESAPQLPQFPGWM